MSRVICVSCGLEQDDRTGIPASKNIPREQGVTVCARCGGIWARSAPDGIVLGDGRRYLQVRDLPEGHPVLDRLVKHFNPTERIPAREDPDMLVAKA